MSERIRSSAARRRNSNGNVILESVFTLLPTFAFIFAFTDFGLMMFRWSTLAECPARGHAVCGDIPDATRGKARTLRSGAWCSSTPWDLSKRRTARSTFLSTITLPPRSNAFGSGGNVPGNLVDVSIQNLSFGWLAPLSGSYGGGSAFFRSTTPITFNLDSADILGGFPVGVTSVSR